MRVHSIDSELEKRRMLVATRLHEYMQLIEPETLRKACFAYMAEGRGGKLLRSSLALIATGAVGGDEERAIPLSAAIEIMNVYTLIHDDIIDGDNTRRRGPAVHAEFGVPVALLAGDLNHSLSVLSLLSASDLELPTTLRIVRLLEETSKKICEGQFYDLAMQRGEMPPIPQNYQMMAERKTACLYGAAAQAGALIGNADERLASEYSEFGRLLGLGFQIWDDVLGIISDEKTLGKPVGSDIREGKMSFPVIHYIEKASDVQKEKLLSCFGKRIPPVMASIQTEFHKTGSIEYATETAHGYTAKAKSLIPSLTHNEYYAELLGAFADFSVERKF